MRGLCVLPFLALAACTAAEVRPPEPIETSKTAADIWQFSDHVERLRTESCPDGVAYERADSLDLRVAEVSRGSVIARENNLSGVSLAGAWHLHSPNKDFGGLSGLDVMRSGSLLSITDDGKFVWIGIDPDSGAPDGIGSITEMRDADGDVYRVKTHADSEDLVFRDGMALVSFEQNHRIDAYDLESCGAAARAASLVELDQMVDGRLLDGNRGAEAMAMIGEGLSVGFETQHEGGSPIGDVNTNGTLENVRRTRQPIFYLITGMDHSDGLTAQVFRAYDPVRGARGIVRVSREGAQIAEANLKKPLPVDNYEGIAIGTSPAGTPRIWLVSDDNFNDSQKTLLLAFDLDPAN